MATQFFLRNRAAPQFPTSNHKSLVLPAGSVAVSADGGTNEQLLAAVTAGSAQVTIQWNTLGITTQQSAYLARFTTSPLATQTIAANTWTVGLGTKYSTSSASERLAFCLFVWRPGAGTVVGRLYDAVTGLGAAWLTSEAGQVVTFSGSSLAILDGDLLSLELYETHTATSTTVRTANVYLEGATAPTQGTATADAAGYLSTPQTLLFQTYTPRGVLCVFALSPGVD
jgi:hypothetical protein